MRATIPPSELIVLAVLAVAQAGIAWVLWNQIRPWSGRLVRTFYWAALAALAVAVTLIIFLGVSPRYAVSFRDLRAACYIWLLASSPAFVIYLIAQRVMRSLKPTSSPSRRRALRAVSAAAIAAPFLVEAYGILKTRLDFQVEEVDLPIVGLHPDLSGIRILHLSDVHLSRFLSEREFARVIDAANGLHPHVAVMTGDLISSWGDPIDACIAQLSRIKAEAPMLGCLGNHEIYANVERYTEVQAARKGIGFLRGAQRALKFGQGTLNIAGIDYRPFTLAGRYLLGTAPLVIPDATNILLSHNPDVFSELPGHGWHALLGGHTHGGQVTVEILKQNLNIARFFTPYVSGLYVERGASCYVTRGIGTIGVPARVGATPEITLLRLKRA